MLSRPMEVLLNVLAVVVNLHRPIFFICAQIDLQDERVEIQERINLARGFTGHIKDSKASVATDKRMILQEIESGGGEAHVDATIDLLLRSGMSSSALRVASDKGVNTSQVGIARRSLVCMTSYAFFTS